MANGFVPFTEAFLAEVTLVRRLTHSRCGGLLGVVVVVVALLVIDVLVFLFIAAAAEAIAVVQPVLGVLVLAEVALGGKGGAGAHLTLVRPLGHVPNLIVVVAVLPGQMAVTV